MAKQLLLSDSNFVNNIGDYKGRKIKGLEVKSCQSRKAVLSELAQAEEGIVVLSCFDSIAADVAKTNAVDADRAVEVYLNQVLFKMVEKLDESNGKLAFGVAAPLFWKTHSEEVKRALSHTVLGQGELRALELHRLLQG